MCQLKHNETVALDTDAAAIAIRAEHDYIRHVRVYLRSDYGVGLAVSNSSVPKIRQCYKDGMTTMACVNAIKDDLGIKHSI